MSSQPDCNIYGLYSTRDFTIRYIGQTSDDPEYRMRQHVKGVRNGKPVSAALGGWITAEMNAGHAIKVKVLDWYGIWGVSEQEYIALFRAMGAPLLNRHTGKCGPKPEIVATATEVSRALMRDKATGRKLGADARAQIGLTRRARKNWRGGNMYAPVYDKLRWA